MSTGPFAESSDVQDAMERQRLINRALLERMREHVDSSTVSDLDRFRAGLDQTERLAREATPGPWTAPAVVYGPAEEGWGQPRDWEVSAPTRPVVSHLMYEGGGIGHGPDAGHIAHNDPERMLGWVTAVREIMSHADSARDLADEDPDSLILRGACNAYAVVVRALATHVYGEETDRGRPG